MSFQNEKQLLIRLRQSLYSRMRITSKTVNDINKMEDNFALRYVFTYPGIISRAELVPSHGASRRRLGDNNIIIINFIKVYIHCLAIVANWGHYLSIISIL